MNDWVDLNAAMKRQQEAFYGLDRNAPSRFDIPSPPLPWRARLRNRLADAIERLAYWVRP